MIFYELCTNVFLIVSIGLFEASLLRRGKFSKSLTLAALRVGLDLLWSFCLNFLEDENINSLKD